MFSATTSLTRRRVARTAAQARVHQGSWRTQSSQAGSSSNPTSEQPEKKTAAIKDPPPPPGLPFLQRPLGVPDKPGVRVPKWDQRREDLKDRDVFESKRMDERRHIIQEAAKGYFTELNKTRNQGGKTWIAPRVLIRENRALYFPDVEGTTLDERKKVTTTELCKGKISVISMLSTRISELHAKEAVSLTNEKHLSNPHYQYIQVNVQENVLRSLLVNVFLRSIRSQVPPALHPTYLMSSQNMEYIREPLGMTNKYIGYTFLVDDQLRVRWAVGGDARPEESEGLERCVGQLLERFEQELATTPAVEGKHPA